MSILCLILLLTLSSFTSAEETYKSGTVAEVGGVRFERSDRRPMLCEIRIESDGSTLTFYVGPQKKQKSCEADWAVHEAIQFRIAGQEIFVKRSKGKEPKGVLASHRFEDRN